MNFTPEIEFMNACTKSREFQSWISKAKLGDADAADKIKRYRWRAGVEVYDLQSDPYEWNNLAGKAGVYEIEKRLREKLDEWMREQGDKGQETELAARERQGRGKKKANKKPNLRKRTSS